MEDLVKSGSKNSPISTRLSFGIGKIGKDHETEDKLIELVEKYRRKITRTNTAVCIDGRPDIRLADGTDSKATLRNRVLPQLPGGLFLATTKAAVAADIIATRDAKDFKQALNMVEVILTKAGYENGGHAGCGAINVVNQSALASLRAEEVFDALTALGFAVDSQKELSAIKLIVSNKKKKARAGFYDYNPDDYTNHIKETWPENFAYLDEGDADHPTKNHEETCLFILKSDGFSKNAFFEDTGLMTFAISLEIVGEVAKLLSPIAEERHRLIIAFLEDALSVANQLIKPGLLTVVA